MCCIVAHNHNIKSTFEEDIGQRCDAFLPIVTIVQLGFTIPDHIILFYNKHKNIPDI